MWYTTRLGGYMCDKYIPKVGEVCEYFHARYAWVKVLIHYVGVDNIVFGVQGRIGDHAYRIDHCSFRKIQSEEEKFIAHFTAAMISSCGWVISDKTASSFYSKGFRYVGEEK